MKFVYQIALACLSIVLIMACGEDTPQSPLRIIPIDKPKQDSTLINDSTAYVELIPLLENQLQIKNARLKVKNIHSGTRLSKGENQLVFKTRGIELGKPTKGEIGIPVSENSLGEHIIYSLNNNPANVLVSEEATIFLEEGKYVLFSTLCTSYNTSLKQEKAFDLVSFVVGDSLDDLDQSNDPELFYLLPNGVYKTNKEEGVLLDFYLYNTSIAPDGNYVLVTINNQQFKITDWNSYLIKGLNKGTHLVKIELRNNKGALVNTKFNVEERVIRLI